MPRDVIVDLPCKVKHELGGGNLREGSRGLVNRIRAREYIDAMRERPRQDGRPVELLTIRVPHVTAEGCVDRTATVGELIEETAILDRTGVLCTNCPANALRKPFGCIGGLPFPVKPGVEQYALERLAPPERIGGALFFQTLIDHSIDGSLTRDYRADAKFEAMSAVSRKLLENVFERRLITSDELFDPLLRCRGRVPPWMALNMLLWFEAITINDVLPISANDVLTLTRMDPAERVKRTRCLLGSPARQADAEPFRGFLKLLHVGWARDVEIVMEC
jgi:hypothetical protein